MTDDQPRLIDYLGHVVQAIERIASYTENMDQLAFLQMTLVQDAVIRNIEVIGEACNNIDKRFPQFAAGHPELPLSFAYRMRNVVAHGYFKVDLELVWKTISVDLPDLLPLAQAARATLPD